MDLGLAGKRGLVVGGSRGIGKAIALELAREGVDIAISARTEDELARTAREISTATDGKPPRRPDGACCPSPAT